MAAVHFFALLVLVLFSQSTLSKVVDVYKVYATMSSSDWTTMNNNPNNEIDYPCQITLNGRTYSGATIEIHGGSSRSYIKKSLTLGFSDDDLPFLNLFNYPGDVAEELHSVILNAAWVDGTFLRNKLSGDLTRELGGKSPRIVYCEFYINNQYSGFYLMQEKIGKQFIKSQGWSSKDGNLYKASSHDGNFQVKANPLSGYEKKNNEEGPSDDVGTLINTLNKTPKTFKDYENSISPLFAIRDWFVYSFVHVYSNDFDGFDKNYYLFHDLSDNSPFRVIMWDSDASWGNTWTGYPAEMTSDLWYSDGMSSRVFSVSEYAESYLKNLKCLIENGLLKTSELNKRIDGILADISSYVARDENLWLSRRLDGRNINLEVTDIKNWLTKRSAFVLSEINKKIAKLNLPINLVDRLVSNSGTYFFTCGKLLDPTSPVKISATTTTAAVTPPPSSNSNNGWSCLSSYTVPFRLSDSGDPSCMSLNGRDCLWSGTCQEKLDQYATSGNLVPLVCGAAHKALYGMTGYDSAEHWCYQTRQLFKINWQCLSFSVPIGLSVSGDPACMSLNGRDCLWSGTCQEKLDQYGTSGNLVPLVCGAAHKALYGSTGYDSAEHWCYQSRQLLVKNSALNSEEDSFSDNSLSTKGIVKFLGIGFSVGICGVFFIVFFIHLFMNRRNNVEKF